MLTFRVGPQGNINDPFFLPSIVDYKIYIHLTLHKMNPLIIRQGETPIHCGYSFLILSVPCCTFAAMNISNYKHKLDLTGIITFRIGDSF